MVPDSKGPPQVCLWHYDAHQDPQTNVYEEFERWCLTLRARNYCCLWTHYPVAYLWECVSGIEPEVTSPAPCNQGGCKYQPVFVRPDARSEFKRLIERIGNGPAHIPVGACPRHPDGCGRSGRLEHVAALTVGPALEEARR